MRVGATCDQTGSTGTAHPYEATPVPGPCSLSLVACFFQRLVPRVASGTFEWEVSFELQGSRCSVRPGATTGSGPASFLFRLVCLRRPAPLGWEGRSGLNRWVQKKWGPRWPCLAFPPYRLWLMLARLGGGLGPSVGSGAAYPWGPRLPSVHTLSPEARLLQQVIPRVVSDAFEWEVSYELQGSRCSVRPRATTGSGPASFLLRLVCLRRPAPRVCEGRGGLSRRV